MYGNKNVSINKLKNLIKEVYDSSGLKENFTNHNGKRTWLVQLSCTFHEKNEQEIMARIGHRSEKCTACIKSFVMCASCETTFIAASLLPDIFCDKSRK